MDRVSRFFLGFSLLAGISAVAAAKPVTVAVLPFKDLSGGAKAAVGEAIRETLTADLRDVPGLRVIERGELERLLGEQRLQATRADLDPSTTVKVGKLLGASLMVTGAYQRAAATVRLTARFVRVETGEVVGSAKVDGAASDFLVLQDRVTVELLRSAGIEALHVRSFERRARPKLKSLTVVELYGDALEAEGDDRRRELLQRTLAEDQSFSYALHDLEALEKRLQTYQQRTVSARQAETRALNEEIARERDPEKRAYLAHVLINGLYSARRFARLRLAASEILAWPPDPKPAEMGRTVRAAAGSFLVFADAELRLYPQVLRDGEAFLKRFPTSTFHEAIESTVRQAIEELRAREAGRARAREEAAKLTSSERWDLCEVGRVYNQNAQYEVAERLYRACLEAGSSPRGETMQTLVNIEIQAGDWKDARRDLADYKKLDPAWVRMLPVDD